MHLIDLIYCFFYFYAFLWSSRIYVCRNLFLVFSIYSLYAFRLFIANVTVHVIFSAHTQFIFWVSNIILCWISVPFTPCGLSIFSTMRLILGSTLSSKNAFIDFRFLGKCKIFMLLHLLTCLIFFIANVLFLNLSKLDLTQLLLN